MNKYFKFGLTAVISLILGFAGCFALFTFFPNTAVRTINTIQKEVTVNDNGISDGIEAVYDSVVVIENYQFNKLYSIGSGFVYNEDGYIITNHHVIDGASEIKVTLTNGNNIPAELIGSDEYADIAVLKIDKEAVISVSKIGNSQKMKLGDTVFAIGSPVSKEYAGTVTRGIISGKDRMVSVSISSRNSSDWIMNVMQTDASINPGNSGGPLCNVSGEVIGVNNMKIVESSIEGIGFAIPIEDALSWAAQLQNGEKIQRAYLGIQMTDLQSASAYSFKKEGIEIDKNLTDGVVVVEVVEDGPSDIAGLKKGDVIVKIGNHDVSNIAELRYYLYKNNPGDKIKITAIRKGSEETFTVEVGES